MQTFKTWRELLGHIIEDIQVRQQIAKELKINAVTLTRWVKNEAMRPRPQNLQRLLKALPEEYQNLFRQLISEEEGLSDAVITTDEVPPEIPSVFYRNVIHDYVNQAKHMRFWSICRIILEEAIRQLDPQRLGMEVTIARCRYLPEQNTIHSLNEVLGIGTPPWNESLQQRALFLGAESLAGYAVSMGHFFVSQNLKDRRSLFPAHRVEWEESAVAYPIARQGNVAGCFLVSSAQPNYFLSSHISLIQDYAELMVLAFEPEEFYSLECMELGMMPPHNVQKDHIMNFRQRVSKVILENAKRQQYINSIQAEQIVWQQLEEEFLEMSAATPR